MGQPVPPADPAKPPAGDPPTPPAPTEPPAEPTNPALKKALDEERAARKELERQMKALEPLGKLAEALGVKPEPGQTDVQALMAQVTDMKKDLGDERLARMRLEVAAAKGLTPAQAARLQGSTQEELAADADALKQLFPGGTSATPGTPAPDPSQGARGSGGAVEALQAKIAAEKDPKERVRLKARLAEAQRKK